MTQQFFWLVIGFTGQAVFASRFIVQWLCSEKQKKSVIPNVFWYLSLLGGFILLSYAIYQRDPVFILGQATGLFVYLRNIYFLNQEHKSKISEALSS